MNETFSIESDDMQADQEILQRIERVEALIEEAERSANPAWRQQIREIVEGLLDYHGAAIARIMSLVASEGSSPLLDALSSDELVGSVLMLYDMHPDSLSKRVERGLASVRPALKSHGGDVELIDEADGTVRLRLQGNCHGCPSSSRTMKSMVEQAILAAAPDVERIEVEGEEKAESGPEGFVSLEAFSASSGTLTSTSHGELAGKGSP